MNDELVNRSGKDVETAPDDGAVRVEPAVEVEPAVGGGESLPADDISLPAFAAPQVTADSMDLASGHAGEADADGNASEADADGNASEAEADGNASEAEADGNADSADFMEWAAPQPAPMAAERLLALSLGVAVVMTLVGAGLAWLLRGEVLLDAFHLPGGSGWRLAGWSAFGVALSLTSTWLPTKVWPQYGAVLEDTGLGVADDVLRMLGPWRMALLVAVAGAGEEVLFRGGLQPTVGIAAAAVLFGLSHGGWRWRQFWAYAVAAAIAGAIFGWVYRLSGSLWVPILAHAAHNIAVTIYVTVRPEEDAAEEPMAD